MQKMEENSIDAVVCDPPYGLEFMGKEWDSFRPDASSRGIPKMRDDTPRWRRTPLAAILEMQQWHQAWATEALRVLRPGGHLLAFGGSRTFHRLACAVEDAGFEIRDSVIWLYGSGFPKSLDVSKAIDRAAGAEREVTGEYLMPADSTAPGAAPSQGLGYGSTSEEGVGRPITAPATPEAQRWQGWGTALKPAFEPVVCAQKPLGIADWLAIIGSHLDRLEAEWQAQEADPITPTGEGDDSPAQTATSPSESTATTSLNTVTSWRNCWAELWQATSTSTIGTATELTTALRTLSSCLPAITVESIQASQNPTSGSPSPVEAADNLFAAAVLSLRGTLALSADGLATGSTAHPSPDAGATSPSPAHEPIVVARKPLIGTVAQNVERFGTGALAIDRCRIGTEDLSGEYDRKDFAGMGYGGAADKHEVANPGKVGRWPANVALSHLPECERVGERRVKGSGAFPQTVNRNRDHGVLPDFTNEERPERIEIADPDGLETVEAWSCVEGCPVRELDRQSGELTSGRLGPGHTDHGKDAGTFGAFDGRSINQEFGGDTGGASRFFYCAKSSRSERNAGLEGFEERWSPTMGDGIGGKEHSRPCSCDTFTEWVNEGQSPSTQPDSATPPPRDTTALTLGDASGTSTTGSGSKSTGRSPQASTFTTSTGTSRTTESETLGSSTRSRTSEPTPRTTESGAASGSDGATSAGGGSPPTLDIGISTETGGSSTGDAAPATSESSSSPSSSVSSGNRCPDCGGVVDGGRVASRANVHPLSTVKPVDLMRWLVRLVTPLEVPPSPASATRPDDAGVAESHAEVAPVAHAREGSADGSQRGVVLDPFAGSGTTGIACVLEDFDFIGIEREPEYVEIAKARIDYWAKQPKQLDLLGDYEPERPKGRWPANVALSHLEGCELVGTKRVSGSNSMGTRQGHEYGGEPGMFGSDTQAGHHHVDPDGLETVEDWRCVEGCPVAELDQQSRL